MGHALNPDSEDRGDADGRGSHRIRPDIRTIQRLRIRELPSTDFITPDGDVHRNWTGILNEAKLTELVDGLLDASL